jgi:hypothetical protein
MKQHIQYPIPPWWGVPWDRWPDAVLKDAALHRPPDPSSPHLSLNPTQTTLPKPPVFPGSVAVFPLFASLFSATCKDILFGVLGFPIRQKALFSAEHFRVLSLSNRLFDLYFSMQGQAFSMCPFWNNRHNGALKMMQKEMNDQLKEGLIRLFLSTCFVRVAPCHSANDVLPLRARCTGGMSNLWGTKLFKLRYWVCRGMGGRGPPRRAFLLLEKYPCTQRRLFKFF